MAKRLSSKQHDARKEDIKESLNPELIRKQGLDEKGIDKVADLHADLDDVFERMKALDPSNETELIELRAYADLVEKIEFALQDAWGFPQNRDFHSWWFKVPHCRCPKMDNADWVGTDLRITTGSCPIHGGKKIEL